MKHDYKRELAGCRPRGGRGKSILVQWYGISVIDNRTTNEQPYV